jgi:hypothetical protein
MVSSRERGWPDRTPAFSAAGRDRLGLLPVVDKRRDSTIFALFDPDRRVLKPSHSQGARFKRVPVDMRRAPSAVRETHYYTKNLLFRQRLTRQPAGLRGIDPL